MKRGVAQITFTPSDALEECVSLPLNTGLCRFKTSGSQAGMLPSQDTARMPLSFKLRVLPIHFMLLVLRPVGKESSYILRGMTDLIIPE